MFKFELIQTIEKKPEEVFSFLEDITNMPMWNYYLDDVTKVTEGHVRIGTVFNQRRENDEQYYNVIELIPFQKITVQLLPPGPDQKYGFEVRNVNDMSEVTYFWSVNLQQYKLLQYLPDGGFKNWLLSFANRHIIKNIKPSTEENFAKLKMLLERGSVVLQNGRKSGMIDMEV